MYNELTKTTKSGGLRDGLIIQRKSYFRLFRKFMDLFPQATKPTKKLLALFLIGQLCTEYFTSVRNLHKTFLSSVCEKKSIVTITHFQMIKLQTHKFDKY